MRTSLVSLMRTQFRPMHPQSSPPCTGSWRQSFCSGWKYSALSAPSGMRLRRCKSPRIGWGCVEFLCFISYPKLLRLDPGVADVRPGQRLFPFCNRVLRGHQRILSTHLSLSTLGDSEKFNRKETIRVAHPPLCSSCAWGTDVMGYKCRGHIAFL